MTFRDTFAQLRNERETQERLLKSKCFICDKDAQEFDRKGFGFETHTRKEHNMWAYFKFYCMIQERKRLLACLPAGDRLVLRLDGTEHYVSSCYEKPTSHTSFYPVSIDSRTLQQSRAARQKKPDKKDYTEVRIDFIFL